MTQETNNQINRTKKSMKPAQLRGEEKKIIKAPSTTECQATGIYHCGRKDCKECNTRHAEMFDCSNPQNQKQSNQCWKILIVINKYMDKHIRHIICFLYFALVPIALAILFDTFIFDWQWWAFIVPNCITVNYFFVEE